MNMRPTVNGCFSDGPSCQSRPARGAPREQSVAALLDSGLPQQFLPELLSPPVGTQHFFALLSVLQLDSPGSLANPVEEELHRGLADPSLWLAHLDVVGPGRGKAKRFRIVGEDPHQEPAAFPESQGPQRAG